MPSYVRQRTDWLHFLVHPPDHGSSLLEGRRFSRRQAEQAKHGGKDQQPFWALRPGSTASGCFQQSKPKFFAIALTALEERHE